MAQFALHAPRALLDNLSLSSVPTRIIFGVGALNRLVDVVEDLLVSTGASTPMLVAGAVRSGWRGRVPELGTTFGDRIVINPATNPTADSIAPLWRPLGNGEPTWWWRLAAEAR